MIKWVKKTSFLYWILSNLGSFSVDLIGSGHTVISPNHQHTSHQLPQQLSVDCAHTAVIQFYSGWVPLIVSMLSFHGMFYMFILSSHIRLFGVPWMTATHILLSIYFVQGCLLLVLGLCFKWHIFKDKISLAPCFNYTYFFSTTYQTPDYFLP